MNNICRKEYILNEVRENIVIDNCSFDKLHLNLKDSVNIVIKNSNIKELIINAEFRFNLEFDYIETVRFTNVKAHNLQGIFSKLICENYEKYVRSNIKTNITSFIKNKEVIKYHYNKGEIVLSDHDNYLKNNDYFKNNRLYLCQFMIYERFKYINKDQNLYISEDDTIDILHLELNNCNIKINGYVNYLKLEGDTKIVSSKNLSDTVHEIQLIDTLEIDSLLSNKVNQITLTKSNSLVDLSSFKKLRSIWFYDGDYKVESYNKIMNIRVIDSNLLLDHLKIQEIHLIRSTIKGIYKVNALYSDFESLNKKEINHNNIDSFIFKERKDKSVNLKKNYELCRKFNIPFLETKYKNILY